MKHLKHFEDVDNIDSKVILDEFLEFIRIFMEENAKTNFLFIENSINVKFLYQYDKIYDKSRKHIFNIHIIDYYRGDLDAFFEVELTSSLETLSKYLNTEVLNTVSFVYDALMKYAKNQNMIKISDIPKIKEELTSNNYKIFVASKNYNL